MPPTPSRRLSPPLEDPFASDRAARFLAMSIRLLVRCDGFPQTDQCTNGILDKCYLRNIGHTKGFGNNHSATGNGAPNGVLDIVDTNIRRPVRWNPMCEKGALQLVKRAYVLTPEAETRKTAPVGRLLLNRPAEKTSVECLGFFGVSRSKIKPAELAGICFAQHHG